MRIRLRLVEQQSDVVDRCAYVGPDEFLDGTNVVDQAGVIVGISCVNTGRGIKRLVLTNYPGERWGTSLPKCSTPLRASAATSARRLSILARFDWNSSNL
jgi:hypothetical protein